MESKVSQVRCNFVCVNRVKTKESTRKTFSYVDSKREVCSMYGVNLQIYACQGVLKG